ncbi:MAG: translation initiation factor eIF-2B [Gammaproteobacteria bacterium]
MDEHALRERIRPVVEDRTHGASELARICLAIGAEVALREEARSSAELHECLERLAAALRAARPSMAPVHNLLQRWLERLTGLSELELAAARQAAAAAADEVAQQALRATRETVRRACDFIGGGKTIMTHSLSSTVREVFHGLKDHDVRAIVSEARPLCEGHALTAQLADWGIPTTLITDAQMGLFVRQADLVLVGADSLTEDGAAVNKAGTYLLALAARDQGIPFYVCCETFKRRVPGMGALELEEMDPAEIAAPGRPQVTVRNVYFDLTPRRLISGWISEQGVQVWEQHG